MTTTRVLAIDAGQTGIKVRLEAPHEHAEAVFRGIDTHEPLLPQLAEVVRSAIAKTGAVPDLVTAGISGLTDRDADAAQLLSLVHGTGVRGATLAHDSTTSFLGALGDARGAVVAAGTGVVTLAVGQDAVSRVDGWGYIMGDAGSGYWIGREALDAVMRAYDGRGPATALTDPVRELWPSLPQAYIELQAAEDRVRIVASFAAHVARLAADGDAVAQAITDRAARELAASVTTSLANVRREADERFAVCAIGGVFRSTRLHDAFAAALTDGGTRTDVALVAPRGEGIDGALALADLAAGHPLSSAVYRAGAA
ncbi:N-acetylglucosamine kinase [Microbacterium sp. SS28]|uniref:N-acetylglucosamine kinase n=1 Tax=Microbacterium sp. SS28 TaxID=2919948 RepID=UPI001FAB0160|nr:BadF/BadG/BcrA/BcrD ATPase family protein [Microbacterium sp. SS28]